MTGNTATPSITPSAVTTEPQYFWYQGRRIKVYYNGPDSVELRATPYRRVHEPELWEPDVSSILVSPAMLFEKRSKASV